MLRKSVVLVAAVSLLAASLIAQPAPVALQVTASSSLTLYGTSTLHNFECTTASVQGSVTMDASLTRFISADITIPVRSIHSGSSGLDDNMYESLKADKFTSITYVLTADSLIAGTQDSAVVQTTGALTIAGTQRSLRMRVTATRSAQGKVILAGSTDLLMTDYGIDPPSFMFGTLKAGNKVSIAFTLNLGTSSAASASVVH